MEESHALQDSRHNVNRTALVLSSQLRSYSFLGGMKIHLTKMSFHITQSASHDLKGKIKTKKKKKKIQKLSVICQIQPSTFIQLIGKKINKKKKNLVKVRAREINDQFNHLLHSKEIWMRAELNLIRMHSKVYFLCIPLVPQGWFSLFSQHWFMHVY